MSHATVVLPVPGLPVKTKVQAGVHLGQAGRAPLGVEALDRDEASDRRLDRGQTDQRVELCQDRGRRVGGGGGLGGRRGRAAAGSGDRLHGVGEFRDIGQEARCEVLRRGLG